MDKFENKIIDMRDMYEERKEKGLPMMVDSDDDDDPIIVLVCCMLIVSLFATLMGGSRVFWGVGMVGLKVEMQ